MEKCYFNIFLTCELEDTISKNFIKLQCVPLQRVDYILRSLRFMQIGQYTQAEAMFVVA